jgi:hypothetical protein
MMTEDRAKEIASRLGFEQKSPSHFVGEFGMIKKTPRKGFVFFPNMNSKEDRSGERFLQGCLIVLKEMSSAGDAQFLMNPAPHIFLREQK